MTSTQTSEHVREVVHRFSVSYEVRPESAVLHDRTIRQVGFCIDLCGRDGQGPPLSPGDKKSKEIYRGLREIAMQIIQAGECECHYQIDEFQPSLRYPNNGGSRATVQLGIHIHHKHGFQQPIDADETRALRMIEDRLKDLGIHRG